MFKTINPKILSEIIARTKEKRRVWQLREAIRQSVEEMQKERIISAGARYRAAYFGATMGKFEKEQTEAKESRREAQIRDAERVAIRDRRDHLLPKEDQESGGEEFRPSARGRR